VGPRRHRREGVCLGADAIELVCSAPRPVGARWGSGEFVCEDAWPPPEPLLIPTIAWRVVHLAAWTDVYRHWTFDDTPADLRDFDVPGDMSGRLAWLFRAPDEFTDAVDGLSDESAFELRPAHCGEALPVVRLVTSMLTEHVHHLAEIGVMRDVHRGRARGQPPRPPTTAPQWWLATRHSEA
jgi:hypothetical protein